MSRYLIGPRVDATVGRVLSQVGQGALRGAVDGVGEELIRLRPAWKKAREFVDSLLGEEDYGQKSPKSSKKKH